MSRKACWRREKGGDHVVRHSDAGTEGRKGEGFAEISDVGGGRGKGTGGKLDDAVGNEAAGGKREKGAMLQAGTVKSLVEIQESLMRDDVELCKWKLCNGELCGGEEIRAGKELEKEETLDDD